MCSETLVRVECLQALGLWARGTGPQDGQCRGPAGGLLVGVVLVMILTVENSTVHVTCTHTKQQRRRARSSSLVRPPGE